MAQKLLVVGSGWLKVRVSADLPDALLRAAAEKAARPFSGSTGRAAILTMRRGKRGSIREQFEREREETASGSRAWKKTKAFGNQPAPARTLHRTGKLEAAWLGGAGSSESISGVSVGVGVSDAAVPYASIFQRNSPVRWRANPKRRGESGRLKAQMKLGMTFGVWVSEEILLRGWPIIPRRIGVGRGMRVEVANVVITDLVAIASGEKQLPSTRIGASK